MLYYMNWLIHDFWTRTGGWEFGRSHGAGTSSPSHWQQVEEQAPKPVGWMMYFPLTTFVPVQKLCVNKFIYALLYEFCFLWFTNCILLSDDDSLIPGCLRLLAFVLNNTLILTGDPLHSRALAHSRAPLFTQPCPHCSHSRAPGEQWARLCVFTLQGCVHAARLCRGSPVILGIWCSTIPHLPGCFCPWTFFQNIGFNMLPSDPFMSHLATQLGYSAGEFQALQLIVLATFGVVD